MNFLAAQQSEIVDENVVLQSDLQKANSWLSSLGTSDSYLRLATIIFGLLNGFVVLADHVSYD